MKNRLILILLTGVILAACKKEPLPILPAETAPYYSINGYLDGEFIDLNVGQEGILISQGMGYNNGILSYHGQIVSPTEDLLIKIEFTRPEAPISTVGLSALTEGEVDFLVHQSGCKSLSFGDNLAQTNYLLIKNEQESFEPVTEINFDEYGVHNVIMKFTDVSQNSFQLPVKYGYKDIVLNPQFQTIASADTVKFNTYGQVFSHEWYIDGSLSSTSADFWAVLPNGIHKVEHKIRDHNLNEASYTTLIRISGFVLDWQMDMNNCLGSSSSSNYGNVTVTVLTGGQEYKSDEPFANLSNTFTVSNIEYVSNASGEPTWAVFDMGFDAILVNSSNSDSLSLTGMTGTFNVGLQ